MLWMSLTVGISEVCALEQKQISEEYESNSERRATCQADSGYRQESPIPLKPFRAFRIKWKVSAKISGWPKGFLCGSRGAQHRSANSDTNRIISYFLPDLESASCPFMNTFFHKQNKHRRQSEFPEGCCFGMVSTACHKAQKGRRTRILHPYTAPPRPTQVPVSPLYKQCDRRYNRNRNVPMIRLRMES